MRKKVLTERWDFFIATNKIKVYARINEKADALLKKECERRGECKAVVIRWYIYRGLQEDLRRRQYEINQKTK